MDYMIQWIVSQGQYLFEKYHNTKQTLQIKWLIVDRLSVILCFSIRCFYNSNIRGIFSCLIICQLSVYTFNTFSMIRKLRPIWERNETFIFIFINVILQRGLVKNYLNFSIDLCRAHHQCKKSHLSRI